MIWKLKKKEHKLKIEEIKVQNEQEILKREKELSNSAMYSMMGDATKHLFAGIFNSPEFKEETGCNVELTGVLQIGNKVLENDIFVSVIFSTHLVDENIKYDPNEILDVKWFTYDELLNMKDELRSYNWIINSITALIENKVADIDLVKMM